MGSGALQAGIPMGRAALVWRLCRRSDIGTKGVLLSEVLPVPW